MGDLKDQIIASVVARCSRASLLWTLKQWGRFPDIDVDDLFSQQGSNTKAKLAKKVAKISEDKCLHTDIIGDLELTYIQLHSSKKLWNVFKLKGCSDASLCLDPRRLRTRLIDITGRKWKGGNVSGNMKMLSGAVWMRLHLESSKRKKGKREENFYKPSNSVFMIVFHNSPYVIISQATVTLTRTVYEATKHVFGASSLKNLKLSGRHPMSLADIVHKESKYQENYMKENPLSPLKQHKIDDLNMSIDGIVQENKHEKQRTKKIIDHDFGSLTPPVLEKLEYQFDTKFHGKPVTCDDLTLSAGVVLQGSNMLRGLSHLSALGLIKCPVPAHLTGVLNMAKNSYRITDKP